MIRMLRPPDMRSYLEVHRASVRGNALSHYGREIIDAWAPLPITERDIQAALSNADNEVRIVAVNERRIVGIGAVVPKMNELRACYVLPEVCREGVGTAIVSELEQIARNHGISVLNLEASLNAVSFYSERGYRDVERAEHLLGGAVSMACVRMQKSLH